MYLNVSVLTYIPYYYSHPARDMMKKRVHLNDIQIGMFVEDIEGNSSGQPGPQKGFRISSPVDIDYLIRNNVLSVVVNTEKSSPSGGFVKSGKVMNVSTLLNEINSNFSAAEISAAKATINRIDPHIRQVLTDIRNGRGITASSVNEAVDHVMSAALSNSRALLTLLKLKKRDNGAFLHSVAVSALMITFGRALDVEDANIRQLGIAGLVHDLGKMRLPTSILQKAGKLTVSEVKTIQTHPAEGYALLPKMPGIENAALEVTLYHHEKFDGSGYPGRLVGEKIPFYARIAAICDVYDAMTTVRPYKPAWSQAQAVDLMLRTRGHFDPALLETFISRVIV
jgi:HD-GYP domain-containing protein (c-di-GMP phosphodiesterase class II)